MARTLSRPVSCSLLFTAMLALLATTAQTASAEGVFKEGTTPPTSAVDDAKPKPRRRAAAKKPAPVTPAAPIPYVAYKAAPAQPNPAQPAVVQQAVSPSAVAAPAMAIARPIVIVPAPAPQTVPTTVPDLPSQPIAAPPPPLPAMPAPVTVAPPSAPTEISLKCDTRTTHGKKVVSSGTFYIDLFPSPVFPDQNADFKFLFADPAHDSLIRDTMCLDTTCTAEVTGTAYYLVNRVTKKGAALRITLDRAQGAFYAEEMGKHGKDHLGEQGYCTVQALPNARF